MAALMSAGSDCLPSAASFMISAEALRRASRGHRLLAHDVLAGNRRNERKRQQDNIYRTIAKCRLGQVDKPKHRVVEIFWVFQ